jgi:hypothetical protein
MELCGRSLQNGRASDHGTGLRADYDTAEDGFEDDEWVDVGEVRTVEMQLKPNA